MDTGLQACPGGGTITSAWFGIVLTNETSLIYETLHGWNRGAFFILFRLNITGKVTHHANEKHGESPLIRPLGLFAHKSHGCLVLSVFGRTVGQKEDGKFSRLY